MTTATAKKAAPSYVPTLNAHWLHNAQGWAIRYAFRPRVKTVVLSHYFRGQLVRHEEKDLEAARRDYGWRLVLGYAKGEPTSPTTTGADNS